MGATSRLLRTPFCAMLSRSDAQSKRSAAGQGNGADVSGHMSRTQHAQRTCPRGNVYYPAQPLVDSPEGLTPHMSNCRMPLDMGDPS